jgi:outer membrane protein assembly factor BamB
VPGRIVVKDTPKDASVRPTADALLFAFNKTTGAEVWRMYYESSLIGGGYWACPVPCQMNGKPCLVFSSGNACLGLEATTGKVLWKHAFSAKDLRRDKGHNGCCAQEPVVSGNRVVCCIHPDSSEGLTVCLEVDGSQVKEVWRTEKLGNYTSCNVIWQGYLYGIHHNDTASRIGPLVCLDLRTGAVKWEQPAVGGVLTLIDGKFLSFTGEQLILFDATPAGYKERARSQVLFGAAERQNRHSDRTAPVLSNGRIYCRTQGGTLMCLDVKGPG